jgi:hypothetical protein
MAHRLPPVPWGCDPNARIESVRYPVENGSRRRAESIDLHESQGQAMQKRALDDAGTELITECVVSEKAAEHDLDGALAHGRSRLQETSHGPARQNSTLSIEPAPRVDQMSHSSGSNAQLERRPHHLRRETRAEVPTQSSCDLGATCACRAATSARAPPRAESSRSRRGVAGQICVSVSP